MTILREIEADLPTVKWSVAPDATLSSKGARAFVGKGSKFTVLVVGFSIEDQGFPKGSLGYDGTASSAGTVIHLTRALAEKAFAAAESACHD